MKDTYKQFLTYLSSLILLKEEQIHTLFKVDMKKTIKPYSVLPS